MSDQQPDSAQPSLVGQIIGGRYRLTKLLGQGGMGEVYAADHIHITKQVAVKLLHAEISTNAEAVARFKQEAQSASSIGHDNIIRIDDFFEIDGGRVCLCMEFLAGQSLDCVIHRLGVDDPVHGLRLMCQVCEGLGAAHSKGIIHRDMKPENVFLSRQADGSERVKILDFGIAKVTGEAANDLTKTGMVFGTPRYMSPEQALGHEVDPRADIYSVGIMLFEMFVGEVPFKAESFMGVLSKHITQPPPVPSSVTVRGRVPEPVERIILKAMAKEPNKRFQSMGEIRDALVQVQRVFGGAGGDAAAAPTRMGAPCPMEAQQERPAGRVHTAAPQVADPREDMASAATMMPQQLPPGSTGTGPMAGEVQAGTGEPTRRGSRNIALVVGLVLMVGLGVGLGQFFGGAEEPPRSASRTGPRRVDGGAGEGNADASVAGRRVAGGVVTSDAPHAPSDDDAGAGSVAPVDSGGRAGDRRQAATTVANAGDAGTARDSRRPGAAGRDARVRTSEGNVPADGSAPPPKPPVQPPEAAPRAFYQVTLITVPSDAAVYRGGAKLRKRTPLRLKVRPGERVRLRLAKAGRQDREVTIVGDKRDRTVRVTLKRRSFGMPGAPGRSDAPEDGF